MNITLPNGNTIENVPEGATKAQVQEKAIALGLATKRDFMSALAGSQTPDELINNETNVTDNTTPTQAVGLSRRGSRKSKAEAKAAEAAYWRAAQQKYGDEDTVKTYGRGKSKRLDKDELQRRINIDRLGFEPEGSANPLVHAGKFYSDVLTGVGQLVDKIPGASDVLPDWATVTPEEYKQWEQENLIYQTADQPFGAQLAGDVLAAAPFAFSGPAQMALGFGAKKAGATALGENILARQGMKASMTPGQGVVASTPGLMEGATAATTGAVLPVDPTLSTVEQLKERGARAGIMGVGGAAAGAGGRYIGKKAQEGITKRLRDEIVENEQSSLPHRIEYPTQTVYGVPNEMALLKETASALDPNAATFISQKQLYNLHKSFKDNFESMNRKSSGLSNETIGKSMDTVLKGYKDLHDRSWDNVNSMYRSVSKAGDIKGNTKQYDTFLDGLKGILGRQGRTIADKKVKAAFKELKNIDYLDPNNLEFDARQLFDRYQVLNQLWSSADGSAKVSISDIKDALSSYMTHSTGITGDRNAISRFRDATSAANKHYKTFRGDPTIDKWMDGDILPSDVSRRAFSSEALDYTAMPRRNIVDKVLSVTGEGSKPYLRNEVFANLTPEIGVDKVKTAVPNIQKHILSGNDGDVYTRLFRPEQLQQFKELKLAMDRADKYVPKGADPLSAKLAELESMGGKKKATDVDRRRRIERSASGKLFPSNPAGQVAMALDRRRRVEDELEKENEENIQREYDIKPLEILIDRWGGSK